MSQSELERELARATGETVGTIRAMGFSLVEVPYPEPQTVDWENIDENRLGLFPKRKTRPVRAA